LFLQLTGLYGNTEMRLWNKDDRLFAILLVLQILYALYITIILGHIANP